MMDLNGTKYLAMFLLGGVSLFLGFIPLKIGKHFVSDDKEWKRTLTSVLLCFGGGVLFATSMIHMLPEVRESLGESGFEILIDKPFAEIFSCFGFFLIYFIEEIVHFFVDSSVHHHHNETIQVHRSFSIHSQACEAGLTEIDNCSSPRIAADMELGPGQRKPRARTVSYPAANYRTFSKPNEVLSPIDEVKQSITRAANATATPKTSESTELPDSCSTTEESNSKSALRDFLTVLALSLHAVFEGLAVGLEKDTKDVWILFAAVATHKYVISFCVGLELFHAHTRLALYTAYIIIYAILTPIGIGIGIGISQVEQGPAYFVIVGFLQALAGGTIIYVVVFEVLERERSKNVSGLAQLFFVILGFCAMLAVELGAPHSHSEHDDHDHGVLETSTTLLPAFQQ